MFSAPVKKKKNFHVLLQKPLLSYSLFTNFQINAWLELYHICRFSLISELQGNTKIYLFCMFWNPVSDSTLKILALNCSSLKTYCMSVCNEALLVRSLYVSFSFFFTGSVQTPQHAPTSGESTMKTIWCTSRSLPWCNTCYQTCGQWYQQEV